MPAQTLDEAIEQSINLGEKNPLTIARSLIKEKGEEWTRDQLWLKAESLIHRMAAERMRARARKHEAAAMVGGVEAVQKLKGEAYWKPEVGHVGAKDMTPDDFEARALYYAGRSQQYAIVSVWYTQVAAALRAAGAATLGDYLGELPALPVGADKTMKAVAAEHAEKVAA